MAYLFGTKIWISQNLKNSWLKEMCSVCYVLNIFYSARILFAPQN